MPELKFVFDANRLPRAFDQARFEQAVIDELDKNLSTPNVPANRVVQAAIIGMLLLDEHFDPSAPGFVDDVRRAWIEFLQRRKDVQGRFIYNREVYAKIAEIALKIRTGNPDVTVFFQEFATVGRHVSEGVAQIPPDHPNFETQVRIGFDRYVAGRPPLDSLELPPLTGEDGTDVEIEPENIRAVGLIYAAHSLEEMRLFHVVDRITEVFMNGALPIGFDAGGRALDTYYWDREDRMNEAERRMQYSRVLGAPGGDVSREVQPNTTFDGLFLRFLSAIAEFDRQQRIDELFDANSNGGRSLNLTGEYVRKAGRDLAANASLYGWGGTHFAARRINNHIAVSLDLLKQPSIQKAYGVTNPYQVIERVATTEFGVTPNIVRYRTMAEAGNKILDIVAKNHKVWARTGGRPLFSERIGGENFNGDISPEDQAELVRQTQFWLAVNGIKDDQVDKLSQPEISTYVPSVPTFGNMLPGTMPARNGHGATNGSGAMDKLKAMVAAGQAPTLDQLQQLVKFGS